jgi:hypothetical protein
LTFKEGEAEELITNHLKRTKALENIANYNHKSAAAGLKGGMGGF